MVGTSTAEGIVVVLDGEVTPGLRRMARKWSFTVLEIEAAEQACRHVRSAHPRVVVLQLGKTAREAFKFIRLSSALARRAPLVVVAQEHTIDLERKALRAGAKYYVPGVASGLLDSLLEAVLAPDEERKRR